MPHRVTVRNESGARAKLAPLSSVLERLMDTYAVKDAQIDVLLTTDEALRELNKSHRDIDEATDVLTFPGPGWPGAPLGDIAISVSFAQRGADERGTSLCDELATLAVHGGLHLLGYDDVTEEGRTDMVRRMNEVLASAGYAVDDDWHSLPHGEGA